MDSKQPERHTMTTDHNIVLLDTWIEKAKAARLDASERADLKPQKKTSAITKQ